MRVASPLEPGIWTPATPAGRPGLPFLPTPPRVGEKKHMATSQHMSRALALAQKARHQTSPNPMVGAVLLRDGKVVGEGYHHRAGGAHAEVAALKKAGWLARGATMYVTLEPCSHHGRTGPCTEALLAAGVSRVVVAMEDPDPRVRGAGIRWLRARDIGVEVGDGAYQAEALNRRWLLSRRAGRPFVALKYASTMDGKIASRDGDSHWVTGPQARRRTHDLRSAYDAIAVGANTVLVDDPELTARSDGDQHRGRQPVRVVVDGRLRVSSSARVFDPQLPGRSMVATTDAAADRHGKKLRASGVDVRAFAGSGGVEIVPLLEALAAEGVTSVLVEGGGELGWSFVASGTVDHVYAFVAPQLVGGKTSPTPVGGEGFPDMAHALKLEFVSQSALGDDILIEAVPA
jgi:diaminohydroxyphosphoribosylaminopyrimidine deaminase/5-amino-6-(5-phosphoribosylamino)uracil reductase